MKKAFFFLMVIALASCGGRAKKVVNVDAKAGQTIELGTEARVDTVDFGRVREGEQLTKQVNIRNAGAAPLVITQVDLSCGCVQADYPREPLQPSDEKPMTLVLDTHDLAGRVYKTVGVRTSQSSHTLVIIAEING